MERQLTQSVQVTETQRKGNEHVQQSDQLAAYEAMLADMTAYIEGIEREGELRSYQLLALKDVLQFLHSESNGDYANPLAAITKCGYIEQPTASGKTVVMAALVTALGIGKPKQETQQHRRALILTHSKTSVTQALGMDDVQKGFQRFAPHIAATPYFETIKDLSGDVVIMTYASFRNLMATNRMPHFDLILCDEAHHTLGRRTAEMLHVYRQGRVAIGLTATPEYSPDRSLRELFGEEIHKTELRPLIEAGHLSGVQVLGFATGNTINTRPQRVEFTEKELEPLLYNEQRNRAIVELAAHFIAEGRRGIINAIAGNDCYHAQHLAELLCGQYIVDATGRRRPIRAAAVGSFTGNHSEEVLAEYSQGLLDVIVQVQYLGESWDEDEVNFIINACPTASPVVAAQRLGRSLRKSKQFPITVVAELMDRIHGKRQAYTVWHVLGEEVLTQGALVASTEVIKNRLGQVAVGKSKQAPHSSLTDVSTLSAELRRMSEPAQLNLVRDLIIANQETYDLPSPGSIPVNSLLPYVQQHGFGPDILRNILDEGGFDCRIAKGATGYPQYYVDATAEEYVRTYEFIEFAPEGYKTFTEVGQLVGVYWRVIWSITQQLKLRLKVYTARATHRKHPHLSPAQIKQVILELHRQQSQTLEEGTELQSLGELSTVIGQDRSAVHFFMARHLKTNGVTKLHPINKQPTTYYAPEEAQAAIWHFSHTIVPKGAVILEQLAQRLHIDEDTLTTRLAQVGLGTKLHKGRFTDAAGEWQYTLYCNKQVADMITQQLSEDRRPLATAAGKPLAVTVPSAEAHQIHPDYEDLGALLVEIRCDPLALRFIMRSLRTEINDPIKPQPDGQIWIHKAVAEALRRKTALYAEAPDDFSSAHNLAEAYELPPQQIVAIIRSIVLSNSSSVAVFRDAEDVLRVFYRRTLSERIKQRIRAELNIRKPWGSNRK